MASTAAAAAPAGARDFAALLADLAAPEKKIPPARDLSGLDGLADDVATLSYESALRTHARYSSAAGSLTPARPEAADAPLTFEPIEPALGRALAAPAISPRAARERLRSASVTVRLSPAEDEQLRQRAAEAGLTVSAYLRSCTFEVESLRAQVKATLAELRRSQAAASGGATRKTQWWLRWWPRRK